MKQEFPRLRHVTGTLLALAISAGAGSSTASAKVLNLYTGNASKNTAVEELERIAEEIKQRTNGEVEIRVHLAGSLQIQVPDMTLAVSDGVIQIGDDQQFASAVPVSGILRLPALIRTRDEYAKAAEIVQPYVDQQYAKYGVTVLGTYYYPPLEIFASNKKISNMEDLKGLKIRSLSAESSEWIKKVAGGIPITLSFSDLAPALDNGTVDGMTTVASGAGYALRDQVKHNYRVPIAFSQVYEIINDDALSGLSRESQKVVKDVFAARLTGLSDKIADADVTLLDKMKGQGMGSVAATPDEVARSEKLMEPFWEQWAKERGPEAQEALAKVRAALGR